MGNDGQIISVQISERSVVIMARRMSEKTARIIFDNGTELIVPESVAKRVGAQANLPERFYFDIQEACREFCMSENHFRKLLRQSGINAVDAAGKKLYSVKEIVTYLDYCRVD